MLKPVPEFFELYDKLIFQDAISASGVSPVSSVNTVVNEAAGSASLARAVEAETRFTFIIKNPFFNNFEYIFFQFLGE
jgi:hypothetical protein